MGGFPKQGGGHGPLQAPCDQSMSERDGDFVGAASSATGWRTRLNDAAPQGSLATGPELPQGRRQCGSEPRTIAMDIARGRPGRQIARCHAARRRRATDHGGFTLIEVLMVVMIVAILAAAVIPAIGEVSEDAKDATLMRDLQLLRAQIELFRLEHDGNPPGWNGVNPIFHMLMYSNTAGNVSAVKSDQYPYGPYLPQKPIANPFNDGIGWKFSSDPSSEVPDHTLTTAGGILVGWFYNRDTGQIAANAEGNTADGTPRIKL